MPYKDKEKLKEYQRSYAKEHSSLERVRKFRNKPCNNPETNPIYGNKPVIEELQRKINNIQNKADFKKEEVEEFKDDYVVETAEEAPVWD